MRRFLFLWGVVLPAFLLSCSKEAPLQSNEVEETVYQKVGRMHNEGLDYVLDYIKQNKGSIMTRSGQPLSKDDFLLMVEPAVKEFIRTSSESGRFGLVTRVSEDELSFDFSGLSISEIRESLNDSSKDYFDRFVSIIESDEGCNRKLTFLSGLVSEISEDNRLDHLSKESLLYLVEVGTSSLKYWTESIQEWYSVLNCFDAPNTRASYVTARGHVVDYANRGLYNIPVCIVGTYPSLGTLTDSNGDYLLVINPDDVLVISQIGYQSVYIAAAEYLRGPMETVLYELSLEGYLQIIAESDAVGALGACMGGCSNPYGVAGAALGSSVATAALHLADII